VIGTYRLNPDIKSVGEYPTFVKEQAMTIQQIIIFRTLCSEMNYSKAAEKLFMTRQAVRQNVSAIESELGGQLFENDKNHISLTSKGKLLLQE
jgi:protein-tyrosine phosphatase